jgi:hypothetical protein
MREFARGAKQDAPVKTVVCRQILLRFRARQHAGAGLSLDNQEFDRHCSDGGRLNYLSVKAENDTKGRGITLQFGITR